MAWETVLGSRPALRVLLVGDDRAARAALDVLDRATRPRRADDEVLPRCAPDLGAALSILAESRFDCVLLIPHADARADLAAAPDAAVTPDTPTTPETMGALRAGCGSAALVVVCDAGCPEKEALEDLADLVLGPDELVGGGVRALRQASEHARAVWRLRLAETHAARTGARSPAPAAATSAALFTIDRAHRVTSWTDGAAALYGYAADEVVGRDLTVLHPDAPAAAAPVAAAVTAAAVPRITSARTRDGLLVPVLVETAPQVDAQGRSLGAVLQVRAQPRAHPSASGPDPADPAVHADLHDGLTGLPNAAHLSYRLTQELGAARRSGVPVAVLVVDLDRFRAIDDLHGRIAGDRVLAEVAQRLLALVRPTDLVARTGGDGFAIVRPATDEAAADRLARRVVDAIGAPIALSHRAVRVDASVGVAVAPPLGGGAAALLKLAELALYEAKARGRAQVQVFDASVSERSRELLRLSDDLRSALAEDRLDVRYQPMIDVASGRLAGYEALTRWQDPVRGEVSPGLFVRVAEQGGFAADLDRWVLARSCRDLAAALRSGELTGDTRLSVNLSTRSLGDLDLAAWLEALLRSSALAADALVLEVTETAIAHDLPAARRVLTSLRALGVGIALDDFGTGYSSLSFLRDLPVTQVKVDRSFVANLGAEHPGDLFITESVVDLARRLGLETVAEGVETPAQLAVLRRIGCDLAQGHLWSGAVPADRLGALDGPGRDGRARVAEQLPRPAALRRAAAG